MGISDAFSKVGRNLSIVLAAALPLIRSAEAAASFYERFTEAAKMQKGFVWDNDLIQTNNPGPILTNSAIPYSRFAADGELAGVKLGMTMEEVVAVWGKPHLLVTRCFIGPRFWYGSGLHGDLSLWFIQDRLVLIAITGSLAEQIRFDNGLTGKMTKAECGRILGDRRFRPPNEDGRLYAGDIAYQAGDVRIDLAFTTRRHKEQTLSPEHLFSIAVSLEREAVSPTHREPEPDVLWNEDAQTFTAPTNTILTSGLLYMTSRSNLLSISNAVNVASGLRVGMAKTNVDQYLQDHGMTNAAIYSLSLDRGRTLTCPYPLTQETSLVLKMQCSQVKPGLFGWGNPVLSGAYIESEGANIISITFTNAP